MRFSAATMRRICARNHGSIAVQLVELVVADARRASRRPRRRGGRPSACRRASRARARLRRRSAAAAILRRARAPAPPSRGRAAASARRGRGSRRGRRARPRPSFPVSSERAAFCSASQNVRPMLITSPTLFICVPSVGVGAGELLEREARPLDDDVVDDRLERGARARDVVLELVERVADRELRRDLRDRIAGRLRSRAPSERDTRGFISMTWNAPGLRVDRELHVRRRRSRRRSRS